MNAWDMIRGVEKIVDCAAVKPGENVLILTDTGMNQEIADLFSLVCSIKGAEPIQVTMKARERSGMEPPKGVAATMKGCDVAFELTSSFVHHSYARQEACKNGTRYLYIGDIDREILKGPGAIEADFVSIAPKILETAKRITAAKEMRITTEVGTDLVVDISRRPGRALTGLTHEPGSFGAPPCVEAGVIPEVGSAEGNLVVDAFAVGVGLISQPIFIKIKQGRAVEIKGGREAQTLKEILVSAAHPNAYNVSEVGIGFNDKARLTNNVTSAESMYGTAHVALGKTPADQGVEIVYAPVHIDLVFKNPTILLDGNKLFDNGKYLEIS